MGLIEGESNLVANFKESDDFHSLLLHEEEILIELVPNSKNTECVNISDFSPGT
jgi:hypothetical protein